MLNETTDILADIVRPEHQSENTLPEGQSQKTDRKQPPSKPRKSSKAMILYFNLFHKIYLIRFFRLLTENFYRLQRNDEGR